MIFSFNMRIYKKNGYFGYFFVIYLHLIWKIYENGYFGYFFMWYFTFNMKIYKKDILDTFYMIFTLSIKKL